MGKNKELIERLRNRAANARREGTATALGDALHFEEAADALEDAEPTLVARLKKLAKHAETSPVFTDEDRWMRAEGVADLAYEAIDVLLKARDLVTAFLVCEVIAAMLLLATAIFAGQSRVNDILFGVILGVLVTCELAGRLFKKIIKDANK